MSDERLQQSQSPGGPHHFLSRLVGDWEGTVKTWFEPGKLADESPISGTLRSVLGGRFVVHEYTSQMMGKPLTGIATLGFHLDGQRFTMTWVDSFHTGTLNMTFEGTAGEKERFSVLGSYADPSGGPPWGWRMEAEVPEADRLVITHYNIIPNEGAAKAVEVQYRRRSAS